MYHQKPFSSIRPEPAQEGAPMAGTVTLVGAGPGGKALLTLAGAAALQKAEAVVYDRLVSDEILSLIPETAERYCVGKENSRHPVPQPEIQALLARLAQNGRNVVRLKGGDCFLFGRGGEECEFLKAAGIPFRVIPGVSSALAVPAYAGIPVTHRDFCSSLHIITAHAKKHAPLQLDYPRLAEMGGTLVFLMGVGTLPELCAGLLSAGMDPSTPAAVVENGARARQRKCVSTVAALPDRAREMALESPAVIIIGAVCSLSPQLDWFTPLPLHGRTIAVTRPRARAEPLADRLRTLGAEVLEIPCINPVLKEDLAALVRALEAPHDWCAFTSPTGVHMAVRALTRIGRDLRALYGMKFAAVGRGTAEALAVYGLHADLVPETADGVHLAETLLNALPACGPVLLLRGSSGGPALPERLRAAGRTVSDIPVYDTLPCPAQDSPQAALLRSRLDSQTLDAAVFASASAVRGFANAAAGRSLTGITAICMGAQCGQEAKRCQMRAVIAESASADALAEALTGAFTGAYLNCGGTD